MTDIAVTAPPAEIAEAEAEQRTTAQTGATSFSDLVRAHFRREEERSERDGVASAEAEAEYAAKLKDFEEKEGKLAAVYWSTRNASAVALTIGHPRSEANPIAETETKVRLHRVTDWVTKDASQIADLLHECDLLAIRVGEILRGTSERITMRWVFAVQAHLLGFFDRVEARGGKTQRELVAAQREELVKIERYYMRTAAKAARIVYVSGMLMGAVLTVVVCAATAAVVAVAYPAQWGSEFQILLLCTGAGAVGALVSVLARMSGGSDKFAVDFEVGRPLLRRLGLYKPLVGSIFGVALYFLLASGLLMTQPPNGEITYFYGIVAFFAGFSERFTGVIFGGAQRLITGEPDEAAASTTEVATDSASAAKPRDA